METKERRNGRPKAPRAWPDVICCSLGANPPGAADCCKSIFEPPECSSMMEKCTKMYRWFPLMPMGIGILLLLLGYVLDAEVVRLLCMTAAGLVIVIGAFGFLRMSLSKKRTAHQN